MLGFALWQGKVGFSQEVERLQRYKLAQEMSSQLGKPLLVVGGPYGANPFRHLFHFKAHGCGDYCVDLDPGACQGCPNFIEADIRDIPLPDSSMGVAFASHIIEHLPTIEEAEKAVGELYRIAEEIIIVSPSKQSVIAWFVPSHHLWVRQTNNGVYLEQR